MKTALIVVGLTLGALFAVAVIVWWSCSAPAKPHCETQLRDIQELVVNLSFMEEEALAASISMAPCYEPGPGLKFSVNGRLQPVTPGLFAPTIATSVVEGARDLKITIADASATWTLEGPGLLDRGWVLETPEVKPGEELVLNWPDQRLPPTLEGGITYAGQDEQAATPHEMPVSNPLRVRVGTGAPAGKARLYLYSEPPPLARCDGPPQCTVFPTVIAQPLDFTVVGPAQP
jgi:hypothetical protein